MLQAKAGSRRPTTRGTAVLLPMGFLLLCGFAGPGHANPVVAGRLAVAWPASESLVQGNTEFALDLYRQLASASEGTNLVVSPFSASVALAMALAGAEGTTRDEMIRTLHLPAAGEEIAGRFGDLLRSYAELDDTSRVALQIADRIWGQAGKPWPAPFLETLRTDYGAPLGELPFRSDPESSRKRINDWVEEATADRIQDLLGPGTITPNTRLVLTNAVYFLGRWQLPFNAHQTRQGQFHLTGGETADTELMHQTGEFLLAEWDGLQILELPYRDNRFALDLILPGETDGLARVDSSLTRAWLRARLDALAPKQVRVTLPRFRLESELSLRETLAGMGMPSAFDPSTADFSGMDGTRDLYISAVVQKAFIEVTERGAEAAAATGIVFGATSEMREPDPPAVFLADHPFLFLLRDRETGTILFAGRLTEPQP